MSQLAGSFWLTSVYFYKIASWLEEKAKEAKRQRLINRTIKELNTLTDKELRDIGISRGDIWDIANSSYKERV